ncbi:MAG: hypothetical protein DRJ63_08665 [Thermoprotei archaeon]|nr:MAG: hypothetical protein DRJ63_08665 [Thermoprotei archaeon]
MILESRPPPKTLSYQHPPPYRNAYIFLDASNFSVKLSSSLEDYLAEIYRLEEAYGYARISRLARELNVAPATVSKMVKKLEKLGLVERRQYDRRIKLTEKGRGLAMKLLHKHYVVESLFINILGMDPVDAHTLAHYLEHIPDTLLEKIKTRTPCPPKIFTRRGIRLSEVSVDAVCKVIGFSELKSLYDFLSEHGISTGVKFQIRNKTNYYLEVLHEEKTLRIPVHLAKLIHVEVIE